MSDTTYELTTDQAAREAWGAHSYGRYLEAFEVGAVYKHWLAKTVTEADDHTRVLNQDGVLVAEFKRLVLIRGDRTTNASRGFSRCVRTGIRAAA